MIEVIILLIFKSHTAITYGQRNVTRASSLLSGTIKLNVTTRHLKGSLNYIWQLLGCVNYAISSFIIFCTTKRLKQRSQPLAQFSCVLHSAEYGFKDAYSVSSNHLKLRANSAQDAPSILCQIIRVFFNLRSILQLSSKYFSLIWQFMVHWLCRNWIIFYKLSIATRLMF